MSTRQFPTIWLVFGAIDHGEYEGTEAWVVCACESEAAADRIANEAKAELVAWDTDPLANLTVDLTGKLNTFASHAVAYYVEPTQLR